MSTPEPAETELIAEIRRFNRFYTKLLGLLQARYLGSPVGFGEARVLFELGQRPGRRAAEAGQVLGLDRGYLSRLVTALVKKGLVRKSPDPSDSRARLLRLTEKGEAVVDRLDSHSDRMVASLLTGLSPAQRTELVESMSRISELLRKNKGEQA